MKQNLIKHNSSGDGAWYLSFDDSSYSTVWHTLNISNTFNTFLSFGYYFYFIYKNKYYNFVYIFTFIKSIGVFVFNL